MKAARAAATEIRRSKLTFQKTLAENIDTDKKSFYAYVQKRSRTRTTVGPLVDGQGTTFVALQDLFENYNNYFASVFTNLPVADSIFGGDDSERLLKVLMKQ